MIKAYFKTEEQKSENCALVFQTLNKNLVTKIAGHEIVFFYDSCYTQYGVCEMPCYDRLIASGAVMTETIIYQNIKEIPALYFKKRLSNNLKTWQF